MKRLSHSLILPSLMLLAVIVATAWAIKFSSDQSGAAQRKLTAQQALLREAQSRVQKSGAEKELIARYLPDYQKLGALGFVGEEQRINWLDALRNANQISALFGINYDIAVRQAYTHAALLAPGQMNVMQSVMKLRVSLLHEEDLPRFLDVLAAQKVGVFLVDQCTLRRTASIQFARFQPNMNAECQLAWITAQPAAPAMPPEAVR